MDNPNEISVNDLIVKIKSILSFIKSKWITVLIVTLMGASLGLAYSLVSKPKYTAVCTFVLDEGDKGGGLGQYAGLASLAGISLGDGGGIFKGDNILELYKSRLMIKKTLLAYANFQGKKQRLIDRYTEHNNLLEKWKKDDNIDSINFNGDPEKFSRKQDSLITDIAILFNTKSLDVSKPDKKLSIINVTFTDKDELFAKDFTDKLVETVNDFYVQTKTKKSSQNIFVLQHQADSVKSSLNNSLNGVASAIDAAPNANPSQVALRVPSQRKQIDVQANTAIYSEIVKNLEISRVSLMQQTPLIQFIDQPVLPLTISHVGKVKGIAAGAILALLLTLFYLVTKKIINMIA